ncbi:MAG: response regulator [Anaerocolumna sp.]
MSNLLKVIIVDDEVLIRNLIKMKVDWEELGMEVIAEYSSSQEALESVEEKKPDIILSDICMPLMNGIELAKKCKLRIPDVKVVIITGYDEFEFALDSIKIGVSDYILKPIKTTVLMNALKKVKGKILKEQNFKNQRYMEDCSASESQTKLLVETNINELMEINSKKLMKDIILYIDNNISNPDLNVNMVAHHFFFSTGYFCRMFKKTMDRTFGEYLSDLRYSKAKDYLCSTDLKCYEIGQKIGITDAHYLSIWFKKKSGVPISKYREIF